MNERIRELVEQAGKTYAESFRWEYMNDIDKEIFEKFAELIVQECATAITNDDLAKDSGTLMMDSYAKGMRYSALLIKEHFGVEE